MENDFVVMLLAGGTLLLAGRLLRALPKAGLAPGPEVDAAPYSVQFALDTLRQTRLWGAPRAGCDEHWRRPQKGKRQGAYQARRAVEHDDRPSRERDGPREP